MARFSCGPFNGGRIKTDDAKYTFQVNYGTGSLFGADESC